VPFSPPTLEYLGSPESLKLLRARSLPRPKDPALYLRLDQIENGATPTEGRLNVKAQVEGSCELRDGKIQRALRFDGKTGRVVLANAAGLNLKDLTVSLWVNAENTGERRGIFSRQGGSAGFSLFFWNGSLAAEAGGKDGLTSCRTADGVYGANRWYHVAVTFQSGQAITLYVDGSEVKKVPMKQTIDLPEAPFLIGWNGWAGRQNDPSPGWFVGMVDELKVWDRVLTADEVLAEAVGD
jgi:hypothetical protein